MLASLRCTAAAAPCISGAFAARWFSFSLKRMGRDRGWDGGRDRVWDGGRDRGWDGGRDRCWDGGRGGGRGGGGGGGQGRGGVQIPPPFSHPKRRVELWAAVNNSSKKNENDEDSPSSGPVNNPPHCIAPQQSNPEQPLVPHSENLFTVGSIHIRLPNDDCICAPNIEASPLESSRGKLKEPELSLNCECYISHDDQVIVVSSSEDEKDRAASLSSTPIITQGTESPHCITPSRRHPEQSMGPDGFSRSDVAGISPPCKHPEKFVDRGGTRLSNHDVHKPHTYADICKIDSTGDQKLKASPLESRIGRSKEVRRPKTCQNYRTGQVIITSSSEDDGASLSSTPIITQGTESPHCITPSHSHPEEPDGLSHSNVAGIIPPWKHPEKLIDRGGTHFSNHDVHKPHTFADICKINSTGDRNLKASPLEARRGRPKEVEHPKNCENFRTLQHSVDDSCKSEKGADHVTQRNKAHHYNTPPHRHPEQPLRTNADHKPHCFNICNTDRKGPPKLSLSLLEINRAKKIEQQKIFQNVHLRSGMVLLKNYISHDDQVKIIQKCQDLGGFYRPEYSSGAKFRLHMMCLGLNWDPENRIYEEVRQFDGMKPPKIPDEFKLLVESAMKASSDFLRQENGNLNPEDELPNMSPDICIVNFYGNNGKLGLHQDKDEEKSTLKKGLPVVSFSLGDSAEFLYGECRDVDKAEKVVLESGDVLIFGGKSRLIYHGVSTILHNTAPGRLVQDSQLLRPGRLNLTFRQHDLK